MKYFFLIVFGIAVLASCKKQEKKLKVSDEFKIGIISDCQYCDCEVNGLRNYRKSPGRLRDAVDRLNQENLNYTIHLGDFIDRDFNSYDSLVPIWNDLQSQKYHVLGNHDFQVNDSLKPLVFSRMNLTADKRYYSFLIDKWRFIVLDGNDLSFHGSLSESKIRQRDSIFAELAKDSVPYLKKWNGALSKAQLKWVRTELELAEKNKEKVGFYCHFPVYPLAGDNLWNREDLIDLISEYNCVKLFFNGHNHAGAYQLVDGVHYLTFKAMVNTEDSSSFATARFKKDSILIHGFGRETSRKIPIH